MTCTPTLKICVDIKMLKPICHSNGYCVIFKAAMSFGLRALYGDCVRTGRHCGHCSLNPRIDSAAAQRLPCALPSGQVSCRRNPPCTDFAERWRWMGTTEVETSGDTSSSAPLQDRFGPLCSPRGIVLERAEGCSLESR
ncbi:uncharacterized protein LOC135391156 [Ornithodoros turicata]|uniref:uncharacterized protein LOC135391156 n=1 Tax=Ornithodoros turicata TaxID=34597 RepID=UPI003138F886